jgi:hypothetical protein
MIVYYRVFCILGALNNFYKEGKNAELGYIGYPDEGKGGARTD